MYKCLDCGHVFEEGEQKITRENHGMPGGYYEVFGECPICGGGYSEASSCTDCGAVHLEDELFDGLCLQCLTKAATYDNILGYLQDRKLLGMFMFGNYFESPEPSQYSAKLLETLREIFLRQKANDLICEKKDFLALCQEFVLEDDGDCGKTDFAEWLHGKEAK